MWTPDCQYKYLYLYDVLQSPWHYFDITVIFYLLVLHNRLIKLLDTLKYYIFVLYAENQAGNQYLERVI